MGDIASSLVSVDELLRDLASLAAYPAAVEFRSIEIVAIEARSPVRVRLRLVAIPHEALSAFQELCRDVIRFPDRRPALPAFGSVIGVQESQRLHRHIAALQNAATPLKRVRVTTE